MKRLGAFLRRPVVIAPLAFLAGAFWVQTLINNFNSQKCHSSLFKSIFYELQRNEKAIAMFGPDLHYDDKAHPRVKGTIDNLKGVADFEFTIEGSRGRGTGLFKGIRYADTDFWVSKRFELRKDQEKLEL
jgi:hypothetical protein